MIQNYLRPQLTIEQVLEILPDGVANRLNPLVIGPQYHISRHGDVDAVSVPYAATGTIIPFNPDFESGYTVDSDYTRIFADQVEAVLHSITNGGNILSVDEPHVVKINTVIAGDGRNSAFAGRDTRAGDVLRVTHNGSVFHHRIAELRGVSTPASRGTNEARDNATFASSDGNPLSNLLLGQGLASSEVVSISGAIVVDVIDTDNYNALVKGPMLNGRYGDRYTLTVTVGGTGTNLRFRIRTASGLFASEEDVAPTLAGGVPVISHSALAGVVVTLEANPLAVGDTLVFDVLGAYAPITLANNGTLHTSTGDYTGPADTTYLIKVVQGVASGVEGAVIQIIDTEGLDIVSPHTVVEDTPFALGSYGLQAIFRNAGFTEQPGLKTGDVYFIHAKAASESTTAFDKVVLDTAAVTSSGVTEATTLDVAFIYSFTGELGPRDVQDFTPAFTTGDSGIVVRNDLQIKIPERTSSEWVTLVDGRGSLKATYRAVVPPVEGEGLITVDTNTDAEQFGSLDLDNVLAYGLHTARRGAQGRRVYVLRTAGTSVDDFQEAFRKAENSDLTYAFAILSNNLAIHQAAADHVETMSTREVKNWRRAYVSTESPGEWGILTKKASGTNYRATVTAAQGGNVRLRSADAMFRSLSLVKGDIVRINYGTNGWGEDTFESYKIDRVVSDTEIILQSGPAAIIDPAQRFEIWKADTADSQVAYVGERSASIGSRRVANIWVERPTALVDGVRTKIPVMYLAAEIAGIRCALLPQQGLTRTRVTSVSSAANMFTRYTQRQLDTAAAKGTFIVTQDVESGTVYIRHQLTTETTKGSFYYEDSVGPNLDSICFELKDLIEPEIGRKNANPQTLSSLRKRIAVLLDGKTSSSLETEDIGPQLIDYRDLDLRLHPVLKDRFVGGFRAIVPLPLNGVDLVVRGQAASEIDFEF